MAAAASWWAAAACCASTAGIAATSSPHSCELVGRQAQRPNLTVGGRHQLALAQPGHYRDHCTTGTHLTLRRT